MIIKELNHVNDELIREVSEVQALCNEHDNLKGNIELEPSLNFNKDMKCIFLLYKDGKLVSVLSIFAPTMNEGEISAYTSPQYRQNGYFKKLYSLAVGELKRYKVKDILFVCESDSAIGKEVIRKLGGSYGFTEYFMNYMGEDIEGNKNNPSMELRAAANENFHKIIEMYGDIFNDKYEDAKSMTESIFASKDRVQYIATLNGEPIGIASVYSEKEQSCIYGLGILPGYQGKGFGKELLSLILKDLSNKDIENINLEVNSVNERAFNLYKSMNFKVELAYDYYKKFIN